MFTDLKKVSNFQREFGRFAVEKWCKWKNEEKEHNVLSFRVPSLSVSSQSARQLVSLRGASRSSVHHSVPEAFLCPACPSSLDCWWSPNVSEWTISWYVRTDILCVSYFTDNLVIEKERCQKRPFLGKFSCADLKVFVEVGNLLFKFFRTQSCLRLSQFAGD